MYNLRINTAVEIIYNLFNLIWKNLTEFNTAHNRRIAQIVDISETCNSSIMPTVKKKRKAVTINEEEQVINPGNFKI